MKISFNWTTAFIGTLLFGLFCFAPETLAAPNLIANPGLESANAAGALPTSWSSNFWGVNNATFQYPVTGANGSAKAAKTTITSYSSGDAKWYPNNVPVTAGKQYVFSDMYTSNASTQLLARYTTSSGAISYIWLKTLPSAGTFQAASATFTVPAGVTSMTVFHYLFSTGTLTVDDFSLSLVETTPPPAPTPPPPAPTPTPPPPAPVGDNIIANASFEIANANGTAPQLWLSNKWGTNTTSFTYENSGKTGSRSVKTTVSGYSNGDAKWYFEPVNVEPNTDYTFSDFYKSNITTGVTLMSLDANNNPTYLWNTSSVGPSPSNWASYTSTITTPANAKKLTVFHLVSANGWLQIDDVSLVKRVGSGSTFSRGLVTLTFDDGYIETANNALPALASKGFKSTHCFDTGDLEGNQNAINNNLLKVKNAGHEICAHTVSHPDLTTLNSSQVDYELAHSKTFLENAIGGPVPNFVVPYGSYNNSVVEKIKQYYASNRTVDAGYNTKSNLDIYRLKVQNMLSNTTLSQFQGWLDKAKADKSWLILVYHKIDNANVNTYDTRLTDFQAQMNALAASGLTVKTTQEALAEVTAQ